MVRNKPGQSSSLEAQTNEWGALLLLSTVSSLMGKAGEAAKRTGPRSSSYGSCVRDEPEKVNAERWNAKRWRDVMVACPFILPGHLLLGVVGFFDMTALLPRHERGESPVQRRPLH